MAKVSLKIRKTFDSFKNIATQRTFCSFDSVVDGGV